MESSEFGPTAEQDPMERNEDKGRRVRRLEDACPCQHRDCLRVTMFNAELYFTCDQDCLLHAPVC